MKYNDNSTNQWIEVQLNGQTVGKNILETVSA